MVAFYYGNKVSSCSKHSDCLILEVLLSKTLAETNGALGSA